jgi:alkanesulfonate monooxygenase
MAHKKAGGSSRNGRDSDGKRLGVKRLFNMASKSDVFDERLWMGIAKATGAPGNTTCLVGTPGQVAQAIAKYYRLGAASFLLRGFDPLNDAKEFGRELIPMIRQECAVIDQERRVAA